MTAGSRESGWSCSSSVREVLAGVVLDPVVELEVELDVVVDCFDGPADVR